MDRLGIVQLSDLQFGEKHAFGYPSEISKKLTFDIQQLASKHVFTPVYLVVSGDITETGVSNEFDDAYDHCNYLSKQLSIDPDAILTLPGNHDVNWQLAEFGEKVGDLSLKYRWYSQFEKKFDRKWSFDNSQLFPIYSDHRMGFTFILLNSTELETHEKHIGYVCPTRLINTLSALDEKSVSQYTKIAILHHRIDHASNERQSCIENAVEINDILLANKVDIVLTGHVHQSLVHEVTRDNHKMIYAGTGATGVDKTQRADGVQNQYCVHVVDSKRKLFESHWRSYNPASIGRYGRGQWVDDNTFSDDYIRFPMPKLQEVISTKEDMILETNFVAKLGIRSNPFTFSNAEKISSELVRRLFVANEERHRTALRLSGDAIIRGERGSGKTMLLRYLKIVGNIQFDEAVQTTHSAESLPVLVNLSRIHRSEWNGNLSKMYDAADRLIYECVLDAIEEKDRELRLPSFSKAVHALRQKLAVAANQEGTLISKIGLAIHEAMSQFFQHVLLLIDEIAPVFPREFFSSSEDGFVLWMNSIRNSGPYFTRVAVYPNDVSDQLNEERFGRGVDPILIHCG